MPHGPAIFTELGVLAPIALSNARIELHWLAQAIGAAGDAFLARALDDSQSNTEWLPAAAALVGQPIGSGARAALRPESMELVVFGADGLIVEELAAEGNTLEAVLAWLGDALAEASGAAPAQPLRARDYDMPDHPVAHGRAFAAADLAGCTELGRWFANANLALREIADADERALPVRCWPHHFDLGSILLLDRDAPFEEARQIGFGLSPGDRHYSEPYFYVTPFPIAEGAALPDLDGGGHWHRQGFTGAILTGSAVTADAGADAQARRIRAFLDSAFAASYAVIPD